MRCAKLPPPPAWLAARVGRPRQPAAAGSASPPAPVGPAAARLGLFIHWGLSSVAARHEWVKQRERLDDTAYQPCFDHFDPDRYDPARWARMARQAGLRTGLSTRSRRRCTG